MRTDDLFKFLLDNGPTIISVLIALGAFKMAGAFLRPIVEKLMTRVRASPTKVDDALLLAPLGGLRDLAMRLERDEVSAAEAARGLRAGVDALEKVRAKLPKPPRGHVDVVVLLVLAVLSLGSFAALADAGYVQSWHVSVTTSAQLVKPPAGAAGVIAIECIAPEAGETGDTVKVAAGGASVNPAAGASRNGAIFCGSGCARTSARVGATSLYLRGASTVEVSCWAITSKP